MRSDDFEELKDSLKEFNVSITEVGRWYVMQMNDEHTISCINFDEYELSNECGCLCVSCYWHDHYVGLFAFRLDSKN